MHFNPEINLGTVINLVFFVIAIGGGLVKLGKLEAKLNIMFTWFQESVISGGCGFSSNAKAKDVKHFHGMDE